MSAEETKHDLPPGWEIWNNPESVSCHTLNLASPTGRLVTQADPDDPGALERFAKVAWAEHGIPRDEYKAMQRDRRLMNEVRASIAKSKHSFHISFDEDGWSWSADDGGGGQDRPEIIAALGESS